MIHEWTCRLSISVLSSSDVRDVYVAIAACAAVCPLRWSIEGTTKIALLYAAELSVPRVTDKQTHRHSYSDDLLCRLLPIYSRRTNSYRSVWHSSRISGQRCHIASSSGQTDTCWVCCCRCVALLTPIDSWIFRQIQGSSTSRCLSVYRRFNRLFRWSGATACAADSRHSLQRFQYLPEALLLTDMYLLPNSVILLKDQPCQICTI